MARLSKAMISFIVPAYNEEHELSDTLAAIREAASGATQPYEIIVVDDASTDATPKIASDAGAKVIPINRRQIAASRNAGARAAQGEYLFFVDADTRINRAHVSEGIAALEAGCAGGSARVAMDGFVPFWGRMLLRGFSSVYFGLNLGAGAFLFTTRRNFDVVGGFDEQYFAGEEVYFSLELKKLGDFKVLREPVVTSGRKLRMYPAKQFLREFFGAIVRGPRGVRSRAKLSLWYDGKREGIQLKNRPGGAGAARLCGCEDGFFGYNRRFVMAESNQTSDLKEFQLHDKDTGSADVQVALLTHRIEHLTEHLKVNRKDHSSRRGLLKMVAQRRSLLDYLSKTEADRYKNVIEKLNLRK